MVPCKSSAYEVSFEWSHHRISSTDSKVRTTLHVSITDSGSELRVDLFALFQSKQDFQRRKEEMALAVEATRKRLEAVSKALRFAPVRA